MTDRLTFTEPDDHGGMVFSGSGFDVKYTPGRERPIVVLGRVLEVWQAKLLAQQLKDAAQFATRMEIEEGS